MARRRAAPRRRSAAVRSGLPAMSLTGRSATGWPRGWGARSARLASWSTMPGSSGVARLPTPMPATIGTLPWRSISPYNMVTAFLDQLRETKAAIINIGSIQSFVALPNSAAYTTSKGGVRLLTKALAIELSPLGIRVNAIGPGFTATPLNAQAREDPAYMANFATRIPLGRIGTPEDIAGPAVFLASDMARYITGITLPVDGGYLAR